MLIAAQCAHVYQCVDAAMRTPTLLNLFLLLPSTIGATETSKAEGCNTTSTMPNSISRGAERPDGELTCRDRSEGWQQMNWDEFTECDVHELCSDDDRQCKSQWKWKDLEKERRPVTIIDVTKGHRVDVQDIDQVNLEEYKENICDLAFSIKGESESNCTMLRTQNWCKWKLIGKTENDWCEEREVDKADVGRYPTDCEVGPGWNGTLDIAVGRRSYKINWASLVKQPRCVNGVTLVSEVAKLEKFFWTTESDQTLPIEYRTDMCNLKIKIHYWYWYNKFNEYSEYNKYNKYNKYNEYSEYNEYNE